MINNCVWLDSNVRWLLVIIDFYLECIARMVQQFFNEKLVFIIKRWKDHNEYPFPQLLINAIRPCNAL